MHELEQQLEQISDERKEIKRLHDDLKLQPTALTIPKIAHSTLAHSTLTIHHDKLDYKKQASVYSTEPALNHEPTTNMVIRHAALGRLLKIETIQGVKAIRDIFKIQWRFTSDGHHLEYYLPTREVDINIDILPISSDPRVNLIPTQSAPHIWYHDVKAHDKLYQLIVAGGTIPRGDLQYRDKLPQNTPADMRLPYSEHNNNTYHHYSAANYYKPTDYSDDDDDNEQSTNHLDNSSEQHKTVKYYDDDLDNSSEQHKTVKYYDDDQFDHHNDETIEQSDYYYYDDYQHGYYYNEYTDHNEPAVEYYHDHETTNNNGNHQDSTDLQYYHEDDNSPTDDNAYYEDDDHYEDDNSYSEDDNSSDWTACSESN
jgi:hypothetical protein